MKQRNVSNNTAARKRRIVFITFILNTLALFCNPKSAEAQYFSGPIASATGGAGRAAAIGPETHFMNPAAIALLEDYHIGYYYRYDDWPQDIGTRDWSLVILDSHEEAVIPAGFSYINRENNLFGTRTSEEDFQLSLGGRIAERFAIGAYGRRWSQKSAGGVDDSLFQTGFGVIAAATEWLTVGAVFYNVLEEYRPQIQPEAALAFQAGYQDLFRYRLDILYPEKDNSRKKGIVMTGVETLFSNGIRARFGARFDDIANRSFATTGIGFEGPRLAADYSYEQDTRQNDQFRQTFDLRLFF